MPTPQYNVYKHRRQRQDFSAFAALVETPAVVPFSLPAAGRFRVVATAGAVAGELAATLTGTYTDRDPESVTYGESVDREIRTPVLAAGGYVTLDKLERAVGIDLEAGFELWVDAGLGRFVKIAEGV